MNATITFATDDLSMAFQNVNVTRSLCSFLSLDPFLSKTFFFNILNPVLAIFLACRFLRRTGPTLPVSFLLFTVSRVNCPPHVLRLIHSSDGARLGVLKALEFNFGGGCVSNRISSGVLPFSFSFSPNV